MIGWSDIFSLFCPLRSLRPRFEGVNVRLPLRIWSILGNLLDQFPISVLIEVGVDHNCSHTCTHLHNPRVVQLPSGHFGNNSACMRRPRGNTCTPAKPLFIPLQSLPFSFPPLCLSLHRPCFEEFGARNIFHLRIVPPLSGSFPLTLAGMRGFEEITLIRG